MCAALCFPMLTIFAAVIPDILNVPLPIAAEINWRLVLGGKARKAHLIAI
jgi:hypothetical protein